MLNIAASGTHTYAVTSDVPWISLGSLPSSGSAAVTVTVAENPTGQSRTGYITVSETVSGVLLKNVVTVTQTASDDGDPENPQGGGFSFIFEDMEITEGEEYTFGDDQEEYEF